jgi:hypothetical protein
MPGVTRSFPDVQRRCGPSQDDGIVHGKEPVVVHERSLCCPEQFSVPRIFQAFPIAIALPTSYRFAALTILCLTGRIMDLSRTVVADPGFAGAAPATRAFGDRRHGGRRTSSEIRRARGTTEPDLPSPMRR